MAGELSCPCDRSCNVFYSKQCHCAKSDEIFNNKVSWVNG